LQNGFPVTEVNANMTQTQNLPRQNLSNLSFLNTDSEEELDAKTTRILTYLSKRLNTPVSDLRKDFLALKEAATQTKLWAGDHFLDTQPELYDYVFNALRTRHPDRLR